MTRKRTQRKAAPKQAPPRRTVKQTPTPKPMPEPTAPAVTGEAQVMPVKEGKKSVYMKFSGDIYQGGDPDAEGGDSYVRAIGGDVIEVSETKSKQLLRDYPKEWKVVTKKEHDDAIESRDKRMKEMREQENKQASQTDESARRAAAAEELDDDDDEA